MDSTQQRARKGDPEPLAEQAVQRTEAQRSESQAPQALFDRALEREWLIVAHEATGEQKRDGFVPQPPGGVLDHGQRRRVEPLEIVDRDKERLMARQRAEPAEEGRRDPARVRRRGAGLAEQESDLERPRLRRRKLWHEIARRLAEQIAKACERQIRFALRRPRLEHTEAVAPGKLDAVSPDRALADSRLTLEQKRPGQVIGRLEECRDERELLVASDDGESGRFHPRR